MVKDLTYLSYPLPEDVERLVYSGDLTRARNVIDRRLADPKVPDCLKERLRFELRIIDEIPRTYTIPESALLTRFTDAIDGFTREEMELIIEAIRRYSTPEEILKMNQIMKLMQRR